MAKSKSNPKGPAADKSPRIVNRRARHDYQILETIECGIALQGSEVKSIRDGRVQLAEGFARIEPATNELYLYNVDIGPYSHAGPTNTHEPRAPRKLLAHRNEIKRLAVATTGKGATLVPLAVYFKRGWAKVELGLGVGKKQHDKRQDLKKREAQREIERGMTRKRIG